MHKDKRLGRRILLSVVILGLDPRISISVHRAELAMIPGATDARVKPEHDAESAIPTSCEALSLCQCGSSGPSGTPHAFIRWPGGGPGHDGEGTAQVIGQAVG